MTDTRTDAGTREPPGTGSISLTPAAVEFVKRSREREGKEGQALRVGVKAGGCSGFSYFLGFTPDRRPNDAVLEYDGLTVYVDPRSLEVLAGTEIDYERGLLGAGIQFKNPRVKKSCGCGESFSIQSRDTRKENMSATPTLEIRNLHIAIDGKPILKGLSLAVTKGEIHALMGPNGSGKSTLANALMGNPKYEVTEGTILYKGEDLLELSPDERGRRGIFLAFQYPTPIPGVSVANFLRNALTVRRKEMGEEKPMPPKEFRALVKEKMALLKMDESFAGRYLNDGFSGGEKKRAEILQMAVLRPEIAVLDETDSGLDIDALRIVSEGVNALAGPDLGVLLITHYQRILNYIKPHFVHVLVDGRIVKSGGASLALELEAQGYDWIREDRAA